ncbi:hypothetical protein HOP50_20g86020 [Chloropicon primus]|uniref:Uncharacterized protein n=1 Tax=Chloropicon primus TaxID=1764295 RepID=A0A5B8N0I0_9CHLO|nr:hypothetical protein A3770_20p85690 [Chloropicon primus]UPR05252.1 hypothetical protein HOP50_20g86020 [Chloropicon primus]|eukprot:QDZ26051.1 hypothetical protein A3770_20p85690 [Chloropicon primus]
MATLSVPGVVVLGLLGLLVSSASASGSLKSPFPDTNTKTLAYKLMDAGLVGRDFSNFAVGVSQGGASAVGEVIDTPFPDDHDYGTAKSRGRSSSSALGLSSGTNPGFNGGADASATSSASAFSRGWTLRPRWRYLGLHRP